MSRKQDRKLGKLVRKTIESAFFHGTESDFLGVYVSNFGTHEVIPLTNREITLVKSHREHIENLNTIEDGASVDVACYHCLHGNNVYIGVSHHSAISVYECWNCGENSIITLSQNDAKGAVDPQIGKKL